MMNGVERSRLTILETTLYKNYLGAIPDGEVTKRYVPRGKPKNEARIVDAKVIITVSKVACGSRDKTSINLSLNIN